MVVVYHIVVPRAVFTLILVVLFRKITVFVVSVVQGHSKLKIAVLILADDPALAVAGKRRCPVRRARSVYDLVPRDFLRSAVLVKGHGVGGAHTVRVLGDRDRRAVRRV